MNRGNRGENITGKRKKRQLHRGKKIVNRGTRGKITEKIRKKQTGSYIE